MHEILQRKLVNIRKTLKYKSSLLLQNILHNVNWWRLALHYSLSPRYILPLNAAMRIGFEQPNQPPMYYNILDIINSSNPPKLISPCDPYHGSEGNSLQADEVLQVKGVHVARVRRTKSLICVNVKTSQEKKIPSDCPVAFSTEPTYNQVWRGRGHGVWPGKTFILIICSETSEDDRVVATLLEECFCSSINLCPRMYQKSLLMILKL